MAHIFISYCRSDSNFAQLLENMLKDAGFLTWRDQDVGAGDSWRDEIDFSLQASDTAILVMSPASKASAYVNYEWAFAIGAGIRVIPLLLGLRREELHTRLSGLQWLDFSDPIDRPWNKLFARLKVDSSPGRQPTAGNPKQAPSVVEQAARGLESLVSAERILAIETLAQMNDPASLEILAGAVRHPVRDVRVKAASALAQRKDPRAVPALLEAACNAETPWDFVKEIVGIGENAVPELIYALKHADARFRRFSAWALGSIGNDSAISALSDALQDENEEVRAWVVTALGDFKGRAPVGLVLGRLSDDSSEVRREAVETLAKIGGKEALGGLIRALNDPEEGVRDMAAYGLRGNCDPAAIAALTERLGNDESVKFRRSAAYSLYCTKDRSAVPGLLLAIQDVENGDIRQFGEWGLCEIGGDQAASGLIDILRNPMSLGRQRAATALGIMKDREALPALSEALREPDEDLRERAAGALGRIGDSAATPVLIEALKDPEENVRREAAWALGNFKEPSVVMALTEVSTDDVKAEVRRKAVQALSVIGSAAVVPALVEALDDNYDKVVSSAVEGLQQINTSEARAALKAFRRRHSTGT